MLAAMGVRYGSEEAIDLSEEIHKTLALTVYAASVELAKERGAFEIFDVKREENNPFIARLRDADPALYEDMTVKSYLRYRAQLKGEPDKRIRRRIIEAAATCRIKEVMNRPIGKLSLGFKKRVALADAILLRPRVVLLDDILGGLDRAMRDVIGEIIKSISTFSSVVVTGHDIPDLAKWVKKFLVLSKGRIASEIDTSSLKHDQIVARVDAALKGVAL
jgi:ABC-type multidrug transport system ATPase subunit